MTLFSKRKNIVSYGLKRILIAFISLQIMTLAITSLFILKPFMQVTAGTISTQMLALLSAEKKPIIKEISSNEKIRSNLNNPIFYQLSESPYNNSYHLLPIILLIKSDLESELQGKVTLVSINQQPEFYWFFIHEQQLSVGFNKKLIGAQPELTMLLLAIFLALLATIFSYYISSKLNQPLVILKKVTQKLSQGDFTARLPKQDLLELNDAFEQINQLAYHFEHLLEQRVIFLSGISHDIRTPLTRLKLLLAIHQENLDIGFTKKTNSIVVEMEALIALYLDSSEFLLESNTQTTVINDLLNGLINQLAKNQSKWVKLNPTENINIQLNQSAFTRVVNNLISNSFKYADPVNKGTINIDLKTTQSFLQISISDHGKGLPDKEMEEIFKPFFRSSQDKNTTQGNGLGLSICRQICLSQGWEITLSDNKPGLIASIKIPFEFPSGIPQ